MIETPEMTIAENPEEAFWTDLKSRCSKDILTHKREIMINEELVRFCEKKIEEVKNGE